MFEHRALHIVYRVRRAGGRGQRRCAGLGRLSRLYSKKGGGDFGSLRSAAILGLEQGLEVRFQRHLAPALGGRGKGVHGGAVIVAKDIDEMRGAIRLVAKYPLCPAKFDLVGRDSGRLEPLRHLFLEAPKHRADEPISGAPKDFYWVSFAIPDSDDERLFTEEGFTWEMTDASRDVVFAQVYRDTCNPALEDFSPCWLYEKYRSGETALTGRVSLRVRDGVAFGSYEIYWEGLTDRFGEPLQQHGHQTIASIAAVVVGEGP